MANRPNVIVILADDMGFSDIGCFGAEIATPHLDRLAAEGVRMSGFRNCARCCPTRASLLTGVYPHQAGIGSMTRPNALPAYQGWLRDDVATTAEVLHDAGYATWCSGKWHVGGDFPVHMRERWEDAGDARHPLPTQRGFERYYGTLCGAGSFFQPPCLMDQDQFVDEFPEDYHYTDATADHACQFIDEAVASQRPFYGYLPFTAPHWPLHAREEDIAAYRGRYADGWDALREARYQRMHELGLLAGDWAISPRDEQSHPWSEAEHPEWEAERMAVYAAMITQMDRGIGRVIDTLERHGILDDTLIMFMSDNGGCAEYLREDGEPGKWPEMYSLPTNRGTMCKVGNDPKWQPGPAETFMSYDLPWANASNVPFRKFKSWTHEGGISSPFVVRWGNGGVTGNQIRHGFGHIIDLAATIESACGVTHPQARGEQVVQPLAGRSLLPIWRGDTDEVWGDDLVFWEHETNSAVRKGRWKLVRAFETEPWQLHDLEVDRTELIDVADQHPDLVAEMAAAYDAWAAEIGVVPRAEVVANFLTD